jgi:hypothetical protein
LELILIKADPEITAAVRRTAIDKVREFLTHLIKGLAQIVPGFLGIQLQ